MAGARILSRGLKGSTKLELRDKFGGPCSRGEHGKQGLNPWKVLCDDNSRCATTQFQMFSWPVQLVDGAAGALWRFGFRLHGVQTAYDRVFWSRGPSSILPLLLPYGGIHIGCTGEGYGRGPANGLGNRI